MVIPPMKYRVALCTACLTGSAAAEPPTLLPEVRVMAASDALEEQRAATTQKTIVDRAEIESLGGLTVGEVIRKLPGIEAGEAGADGGMSARARGMSRDSVQFLVNGERPAANARYALTQVGRMPAGELERIEILRGASAEFGGAAPVTVNLVMRRPAAQASTTLKLAAGQRGGADNAQLSLSRGGGVGGFSWLLPLTLNRHDMPIDQRSARLAPDTPWQRERARGEYAIDEFILSPRLAWRRGADSLTLWPSGYRNEGERVTRQTRDDGGARDDREDSGIRLLRLRAEGELRVGETKMSGRAAVMRGRRSVDRDIFERDPLGTTSNRAESERREDRELGFALRLDRPLGKEDGHFLSVGVDFARHQRDDHQAHSGAVAGAAGFSGAERHWTLWAQDEWSPRPGLTVSAGLRGESMTIDAGDARRHHALDPSLAMRWEATPGWIARASLGGAIRFPKLEELTAVASRSTTVNSPLEPDRGGNPALAPERIVNLEAGLERHLAGDAGVLGANLYLRRTRDFVERRAMLEGARWVERPWNEGEARHWGLELSGKLVGGKFPWLGRGDSLRVGFTLPRGEVDDTRLGLTRPPRELPRHTVSLGYEASLPALGATWGLQWQRQGATRTRVADEQIVDTRARDLLDAHFVRRIDTALNLRVSLRNLLATDTRRHASAGSGDQIWRLDSEEAGPRTWLVSLEGKW